jgi:SAM-dependent methyltransferase
MVDLGALSPELASTYFQGPADPQTEAWLAQSRPHGWLATTTQRIARRFASDFEVNARLGMYSLHLGGTATYRALLGPEHEGGALLDVGAGTGEVTAMMAPLFSRVRCTETSPAMAGRIRRLGFACDVLDLASDDVPGTFDVVSLLNVLDRTARPATLLDRALAHLGEGGRLVLATPLPARPHVDLGTITSDPDEPMGGEGDTFEAALGSLHTTLLLPRQLRVVRWTRLLYRSQGDTTQPFYEHDDALLLCARR